MIIDKIIGPALIPDKLIYRNPNEYVNEPYYIKFSKKNISDLRAKFHKNNFNNIVNINHSGDAIKGITHTKSIILDEENKKDLPIDLSTLPFGTWILEYSIDNAEVLKMIKENKVNGFSIEGILSYGEKIGLVDKKIIDSETELLEQTFDELLFQTANGNTHSNKSSSSFYAELELVKEWSSRFGYRFSIYGRDHFIDNEPHFHFDNNEKGISCKISFSGAIKECKRKKTIPRKILKDLKYFIGKPEIKRILIDLWNKKNPELKVK